MQLTPAMEYASQPSGVHRPLEYIHDDPHGQEPLVRRYAWATLLYVTLGALVAMFLWFMR
jgi:hypothetical protein